MYQYKFIEVKHSGWTGKPKDSIEEIVEDFAADGWKLVQVFQDGGTIMYSGKVKTKIIFEKEVDQAFYAERPRYVADEDYV